MTLLEPSAFKDWIGRSETLRETIAPAPAAALAATLDHEAVPAVGDPLPALWHWIYFTPRARQSELGADGHPKLGGFMPPIPLPRRMWAGGRLTFHDDLLVGDDVERKTEIIGIEHKQGGQGPLIFVTLRHSLSTVRGLAIEEGQDLVYREAANAAAPSAAAPPPNAASVPAEQQPGEWRDPLAPDPRLLFRYSALTFNAHRIHYDLPYTREEEGYPGLVVQGPLTATLLVDRLLAHKGRRIRKFAFRGRSPLFSDARVYLCGKPAETAGGFELWAEGPDGAKAMTATATIEACHAD